MRYVLDTNALSALMRGDPVVVRRLESVRKADVAVPQPALSEIEYGIQRLRRSKRRTALRGRLELLRSELARAEWSDAVSERFGWIRATLERRGRPIEDFDAAIAAHALANDATLVTSNLEHMVRIPHLKVEDWSAA